MPCTRVGNMIVCSRGGGVKKCVGCGQRNSTRLCDARLKGQGGKTCDAPICTGCTHQPAADKDLCPTHAAQWKARANA